MAALGLGQTDDLPELNAAAFPLAERAVLVTTDRGNPIWLKRIVPRGHEDGLPDGLLSSADRPSFGRNHPIHSNELSNCFGWVFTGGRYWMDPGQVPLILMENGYEPVTAAAVGDLVVYRDDTGQICHVAVVQAIANDGSAIVEGKFGWQEVFMYRVGDSCYGQDYEFYRSKRHGHLLAGPVPQTTP
jgi:hypothetical protein